MKNAGLLGKIGYVCCTLLILVFTGAETLEAATFYVATSGSDTNSGTISQPFRNIQRAADVVQAGDTVLVRGGRYKVFRVSNKKGTASAPITFKSYPGELATIDCYLGGPAKYVRVEITGDSSYLIFDGFELTTSDPLLDQLRALDLNDPDDLAIIASYANNQEFREKSAACTFKINSRSLPAQPLHHLTFKNIEAHHLFKMPFSGRGDDLEFIDNHVYDLGRPFSGYGWYTSGYRHLYKGNLVHDNIYGFTLYSSGGKYPLRDSVIEGNLIYDNGGLFYHTSSGELRKGRGLLVAPGSNNVIRNNIIFGTKTSDALAVWGTSNVKIYNNTIYNNVKKGIYDGGNSNLQIKNNIVYQNGTNVVGTTLDSTNLTVDPNFVDPAAQNFHLQPGSPAIDNGVSLAEVPNDFDGISRPMATGYDIGAFEYIGKPEGSPPVAPGNLDVTSGN